MGRWMKIFPGCKARQYWSDTHKQMVQVGIGSCKIKNVTTDLICSTRYTVASSNSSDKYVIVASKFYEQLVLHDELTLSAKDWIKW